MEDKELEKLNSDLVGRKIKLTGYKLAGKEGSHELSDQELVVRGVRRIGEDLELVYNNGNPKSVADLHERHLLVPKALKLGRGRLSFERKHQAGPETFDFQVADAGDVSAAIEPEEAGEGQKPAKQEAKADPNPGDNAANLK